MAYNFPGLPASAMTSMASGMSPMGPLGPMTAPQGFMDLAGQNFPPLPPPLPMPGMNDSPLEFSTDKNKPPTVRESTDDSSDRRSEKSQDSRRDRESRESRSSRGSRDNGRRSRNERSDRRDRDRREDRVERERRSEDRRSDDRSISNNNHNNETNFINPTASNMSASVPGISTIEPSAGVWGMGVDFPMMGMGTMGPMGPMMGDIGLSHMVHGYGPMAMGMMSHEGAMLSAQMLGPDSIVSDITTQLMGGGIPQPSATPHPTKEIIRCNNCTLVPPNPNAPPSTTRKRPPGCKTIFVGGLPDNITETIIQDIFIRCGEITTLRLSKKNFCHIRFASEASVDASIYLSGYRIIIGTGVDSANTGRLHVDYAHVYAKDDQYEWECKQRQLQRMQRHREQVEEERQRIQSSPPPVVHYTDYEASDICEKIKQDETFMKAVQIVVTWLERGDCTKRNANTFYSMIQSTNSHVRRLLTEKSTYEEELQKAKEIMKGRMQSLLIQCT